MNFSKKFGTILLTIMILLSVPIICRAATIECIYDKNHIAPIQTVDIKIESDIPIKSVKALCFFPHAQSVIGGAQGVDYDAWVKEKSEEEGIDCNVVKLSDTLYSASFDAETNGQYYICVTDENGNFTYSSVVVCSVNPVTVNVNYEDDIATISLNNDNIKEAVYVKGLPEEYITLLGYSAQTTTTKLWGLDYYSSGINLDGFDELYNCGTIISDNQFEVTENGYYTIAVKMNKQPFGIWNLDNSRLFYMVVAVTELEKENVVKTAEFVVTDTTDSYYSGYILYNNLPLPIEHLNLDCEYETIDDYEIKISKESDSFICSDKDYFIEKFRNISLNVTLSSEDGENIYWCSSDKKPIDTIYYSSELKGITFSAALHNIEDNGKLICRYSNSKKDISYKVLDYNGEGIYSFTFDNVPCWGWYWFDLFLWTDFDEIKPLQNKIRVVNKNFDENYIHNYNTN